MTKALTVNKRNILPLVYEYKIKNRLLANLNLAKNKCACVGEMVDTTGIEPVTPTMSR